MQHLLQPRHSLLRSRNARDAQAPALKTLAPCSALPLVTQDTAPAGLSLVHNGMLMTSHVSFTFPQQPEYVQPSHPDSHLRHERDGTPTATTSAPIQQRSQVPTGTEQQAVQTTQHKSQRKQQSKARKEVKVTVLRADRGVPVGQLASVLTATLQKEGRAVYEFFGLNAGHQALKVLCVSNDFLSNLGESSSFRVEAIPACIPGTTAMSYRFRVDIRRRSRRSYEQSQEFLRAMRLSPLSLDLATSTSQHWKDKVHVDEDFAFSLADVLYTNAHEQHQLNTQRQQRWSHTNTQGKWHAGSSASQQSAGEHEPRSLFVNADAAQGLTMLAALGITNARLSQESSALRTLQDEQRKHARQQHENVSGNGNGASTSASAVAHAPGPVMASATALPALTGLSLPAQMECSIYRTSKVAPRVDGRDGFTFALTRSQDKHYPVPSRRCVTKLEARDSQTGQPQAVAPLQRMQPQAVAPLQRMQGQAARHLQLAGLGAKAGPGNSSSSSSSSSRSQSGGNAAQPQQQSKQARRSQYQTAVRLAADIPAASVTEYTSSAAAAGIVTAHTLTHAAHSAHAAHAAHVVSPEAARVRGAAALVALQGAVCAHAPELSAAAAAGLDVPLTLPVVEASQPGPVFLMSNAMDAVSAVGSVAVGMAIDKAGALASIALPAAAVVGSTLTSALDILMQ